MDLMRNAELADRLAAAHALGSLRGGARRRFETMARHSPGLRALALVWQERVAGMTELQPEIAPSPNVWRRIEIELRRESELAAAQQARRKPARRRFSFWAGAAAATAFAAVVAVTAGIYLAPQLRDEGQVRYVAMLQDAKSVPQLLVTLDAANDTLTVRRVGNFHEADDRSLQLWALPASGAPRSLGVLDHEGVVKLKPGARPLENVPALAISLEPRGGAPAGSGPTGPVLFKGAWVPTA